jgi:hypothetical protein
MEISLLILIIILFTTIFNIVMVFLNYTSIKSINMQIESIKKTNEILTHKINKTEQNSIGYTNQSVKNTNKELEILYKHIETKNKELQYQIYKDFDIKKTQTNIY